MDNNLKLLRQGKRLTLEKLASNLSITESKLKNFELGNSTLPQEELEKVLSYFKVSEKDFFDTTIKDTAKIYEECVRRMKIAIQSAEAVYELPQNRRNSIRGTLNKGMIPKIDYIVLFEDLIGTDWVYISICELMKDRDGVSNSESDDMYMYALKRVPDWYKKILKVRKEAARKEYALRASLISPI